MKGINSTGSALKERLKVAITYAEYGNIYDMYIVYAIHLYSSKAGTLFITVMEKVVA